MTAPFRPHTLTNDQKYAMEVARVGFMSACPFFAHYFYGEMREMPTCDIPTAATDGRTIYYNPEYMLGLKPAERVFVLAHEVYHAVSRHPARMKHYSREGRLRDKPWDADHYNVSADLIINANLIETKVGQCNPAWLYDPKITGTELVEDVYVDRWRDKPAGGGQSSVAKGAPLYGASGVVGKGGKGDTKAAANGGRFDEVLEPSIDPVTGEADLPSDAEFKEAIARAAGAAKAMGNMPAGFQRVVDEILEPQVDWREHVRMLVTGKVGGRRESWDRPNRRRLALNPIIIVPGRRGFGAGTVVIGVDTSGSIGERELSAFFAEVGGVLTDVRPKRILMIACDAAVEQVDEAGTVDDLAHIRVKGLKGGGGTSFVPVFDYIAEHDVKPDALIYLTDMLGTFPDDKPAYPVIWCATSKVEGPWGDTVHITVE